MGRGCMLILALGLVAVCFADEQPSGHELDQAKSFINQIQSSTKPLAKMLPLEKDAEKQMSGVIAAFKPMDGSQPKKSHEPGVDSREPVEELGEAQEGQHAIADATSTVLKELDAAQADEKNQQSAAKLAMKRIDATLASMKRAGVSTPEKKAGILHRGGEVEVATEHPQKSATTVDLWGNVHKKGEPVEELGEAAVEAKWAPLENAATQLQNVYATLAADTAQDSTQHLLKKMDKEAEKLDKQASGEGKADGKMSATTVDLWGGVHKKGEPVEELGETKTGALSGLETAVQKAEKAEMETARVHTAKAQGGKGVAAVPLLDAPAAEKTQDSLLQVEKKEMRTLEKEAAMVNAAEKADEQEVNGLMGQLS